MTEFRLWDRWCFQARIGNQIHLEEREHLTSEFVWHKRGHESFTSPCSGMFLNFNASCRILSIPRPSVRCGKSPCLKSTSCINAATSANESPSSRIATTCPLHEYSDKPYCGRLRATYLRHRRSRASLSSKSLTTCSPAALASRASSNRLRKSLSSTAVACMVCCMRVCSSFRTAFSVNVLRKSRWITVVFILILLADV
jgi:hypothetical protein